MLGRLAWKVRASGRENVPATGGLLVAVSHESVLDPVLVGSYVPRMLRYLARNTLFGRDGKTSPWGRLLLYVGAVPIEREGGGARDTLRVTRDLLESGEAVLIFPEGTRSPDGTLQRFRRGVGLIARRTECSVLPVSLHGSHRLWKKGRRLPRLFGGPVHLRFGTPVNYDKTNSAEDIVADLRERILRLRGEPAGNGAGSPGATGGSSSLGGAAGTQNE